MDDVARRMTPEGGKRLKDWYASATQSERKEYRSFLTNEKAFYLFDAAALVVVYLRSPDKDVHVMYFTVDGEQLRWANSSNITLVDRIFKKGVLHDAALLKAPFNSVAIH